jgi:23S rRNA (uridine2479-2'-O)-methyltransferase
MKIEKVYSKNAAYQKFEVLKTNRNKRYKYFEFFVEGVRNINEAIANGWEFSSFLYTLEKPLSNWANDILHTVKTEVNYELPESLMAELSGKTDTSELLAVVKMREDDFSRLPIRENPIFVLFDRPSNKGNLGTILRSCDAMGMDGLILTGHAVDLYDPEVTVSSMGSFFSTPAIRIPDNGQVFAWIEKMRERYPLFQVIGTTAHKEKNIGDVDLNRPTLLMIGNETEGLCRAFKEGCDMLATIPMSGNSSASSLNVACAATVLFYEAARQRRD